MCVCVCSLCSSKSNCEQLKFSLLKKKAFFFSLSLCLAVLFQSLHVSPLNFPLRASVCRWCGESWVMQRDQSCPSDSTSLGTSSKGPCSMATRENEREREIRIYSTYTHLETPLTTCAYTTHHAVLHIAYSTQHSFNKRSLKTG